MKKASILVGVCAVWATLSLPSLAFSQSGVKQTPARSVPVKKVFPFYDIYLGLPVDGRDGFKMEYRLSLPAGAQRPQLVYVLGGARTAVEVAGNGQIVNLPNTAMLTNGRIDIAANQPRAGISMNLEPVIALSRTISVASATNPLTDYAGAIRRAGPLAAFAPKLKAIVFKGATGGEVVFGDGRRIGLASTPAGFKFEPNAPNMRGAVNLLFATPPTHAEFSQ